VETAYEFFKSDVVQQNISTNINRKDLSPVENKAITNISHFVKHAPTEQKKTILKTALDKIKAGGFPNKGLPKELNDFWTKEFRLFTQNPTEFYDKLFVEILDRYNFSNTESPVERPNHVIKNPKVILTLSFQ
jgi:hypothetical protein